MAKKFDVPYDELACHTSHGLALPAVLLHAYTLVLPGAASLELFSMRPFVTFVVFYLSFAHFNFFLTGLWVRVTTVVTMMHCCIHLTLDPTLYSSYSLIYLPGRAVCPLHVFISPSSCSSALPGH